MSLQDSKRIKKKKKKHYYYLSKVIKIIKKYNSQCNNLLFLSKPVHK